MGVLSFYDFKDPKTEKHYRNIWLWDLMTEKKWKLFGIIWFMKQNDYLSLSSPIIYPVKTVT